MEQISKNFSMGEFGVTQTGLPNAIPERVKPAIRALVRNVLQPLCDNTGWRCKINSGFRSEAVNTAVGGVRDSQHRRGEAADCVFYDGDGSVVTGLSVLSELTKALSVPGGDPTNPLLIIFDQAILYNDFIHLSFRERGPNRMQVLYSKDHKGGRL